MADHSSDGSVIHSIVSCHIKEWGLQDAKGGDTPGVKEKEDEESEEVLGKEEATIYRSIAARVHFIAQDRHELLFSAKEICRPMAAPTRGGMNKLKRIGRYLKAHPRLVFRLPLQEAESIEVYSDTDWAGCVRTRKSTSGGCLMWGSHLLKHWSSTQKTIAPSSGEAELAGIVKGSAEGLGMVSVAKDLGIACAEAERLG